MLAHRLRVAGGGLKVSRNLTSACTRPPTRQLSCSAIGSGRRVMRGVGRFPYPLGIYILGVKIMQEYQRQCMGCGKVWHSLVSREKALSTKQAGDTLMMCGSAMQSCGSCGTVGSGTQAQASRNLDANAAELHRLRSCPQCGSASYQERIIDHANQLR